MSAIYTQGFGSRPEDVEIPHYDTRNPASTDVNYPLGKRWINTATSSEFSLCSFSSALGVTSASWTALGGGTTALATLSGDTGTATPSSGDIKIAGTTNQITTAASGSTVTISLPSAITTPGSLTTTSSLTATTTITGGTGITSTTGNIVATAGAVNAGTSMTATAGDITATLGNVIINGAAKQLRVHGGAVTDFIGQAVLVNGTVTVANTNIAATDRIFVNRTAVNASSALGVFKTVISAATNFVVTACKPADASTETGDVSTVDYFIVRQA